MRAKRTEAFIDETQHLIQEACALCTTQELEEAALVLRELLELDPHHALAHATYGLVLKEQGHEPAAVRAFDSAIDEEPRMPVALLNRGILLLKRGNTLGLEDLRAVSTLKNSVGQRAREIIEAFDVDEPF